MARLREICQQYWDLGKLDVREVDLNPDSAEELYADFMSTEPGLDRLLADDSTSVAQYRGSANGRLLYGMDFQVDLVLRNHITGSPLRVRSSPGLGDSVRPLVECAISVATTVIRPELQP